MKCDYKVTALLENQVGKRHLKRKQSSLFKLKSSPVSLKHVQNYKKYIRCNLMTMFQKVNLI